MTILGEGRSSTVSLLDIRLDEDVIVLRGDPSEASGALLKGLVVCSLQDSLTVRRIRLELVGIQTVQWEEGPKVVKHESITYRYVWYFLNSDPMSKKTTVLEAGNYEYPFEVALPGDIPESVEGLSNAYIIYRLKATIERPKWHREITAKKHLRIIRTLSPGMLELSSTMSVESSWPNKCEYCISIPHKACVFGTSIPVDVAILPLLKGLKIGTVMCVLKETRTFNIRERGKTRTETKDILKMEFNHGDFEDEEGENSGRWCMHANVPLPKSLALCVQDCEVGPIKIRHKLSVAVTLINPPGHNGHEESYNSELRAKLPVSIFISPNLLMGDDNEIHDDIPAANAGSLLHDAATPPRYDEHMYDRLWEGLSTDYYSTPLPSGANTPAVLSRNNSTENLAALTSIRGHASQSAHNSPDIDSACSSRPRSRATSPGGVSSGFTSPGELSADDLHASLAATRMDYFTHRSLGNTRPASPEEVSPTLQPLDVAQLSRVPSYRTAVRPGPRSLLPNNSLPEAPLYDGSPSWEGSGTSVGPRHRGRKRLLQALVA